MKEGDIFPSDIFRKNDDNVCFPLKACGTKPVTQRALSAVTMKVLAMYIIVVAKILVMYTWV